MVNIVIVIRSINILSGCISACLQLGFYCQELCNSKQMEPLPSIVMMMMMMMMMMMIKHNDNKVLAMCWAFEPNCVFAEYHLLLIVIYHWFSLNFSHLFHQARFPNCQKQVGWGKGCLI